MSLLNSLRRLTGRAFNHSSTRAKRSQRHWGRIERLENRAMLTGVSGDFDGDGFDDLAIGSPNDSVGSATQAGSVQVLYGSPQGLTSTGNRRFTLSSTGLGASADIGDHFGAALTVGDFNGDGYDDLAIGAPDDVVNGVGSGAVYILFGSRHGLKATGSQSFHQDTSGINGIGEAGDKFGAALAAGDFNRDGRDDLAIGVPGKDINALNNAGAVNIIYGRKSGLTAKNDQQWHQDSTDVEGVAEANDQFGFALAVGDFNGNGRDDLAIGVIGELIEGTTNAGAVHILYGRSSEGLSAIGDQYRHVGQDNVEGKLTADGKFGYALAAGDFNDDSRDDLAVGAPGEDVSSTATPEKSGSVHVFFGGSNGTVIAGDQNWNKRSTGITETPTDTDRYGSALAVAQINRNRTDDLIIGVPGNTADSTTAAGTVRVLFGSATGLAATGTININQESVANLGTIEENDNFGSAVTLGDYNGDGLMDVAVGVPGDQNDQDVKSGGVNIYYANATSLSTAGAQHWLPGEDGLTNSPDNDDQFGGSLA